MNVYCSLIVILIETSSYMSSCLLVIHFLKYLIIIIDNRHVA